MGVYPIACCRAGWHIRSVHHLRSISAVLNFRLAALLLFVNCLLAPVAIGLLLQSVFFDNPSAGMIGSGLVTFSLVLVIPQWAVGLHTTCPLCWTPVLAPEKCTKHLHARKFMGSHRLRVALTILFKNQFRCPYCDEPTVLEPRNTFHRAPNRWTELD